MQITKHTSGLPKPEAWFDTKYYHILYKHRNDKEAQRFIDNLTKHLKLPSDSEILDLACGKGRHAIYLNAIGYSVTGIDISKNSIVAAREFETDTLRFVHHDMRHPFDKVFDVVINLFTSFGYSSNNDNLLILQTIRKCLKKEGIGILDYLNVHTTVTQLIPKEVKVVENIEFNLKRYIKEGYILKDISFEDKGRVYFYQERVKILDLEDFKSMFLRVGLEIIGVHGDYQLNPYNKDESNRLILIFKSAQ